MLSIQNALIHDDTLFTQHDNTFNVDIRNYGGYEISWMKKIIIFVSHYYICYDILSDFYVMCIIKYLQRRSIKYYYLIHNSVKKNIVI